MLPPQRKGQLRKRDGRRVVWDSRLREQQERAPRIHYGCSVRDGGGEERWPQAHDKKPGEPHFTRRWNCPEDTGSHGKASGKRGTEPDLPSRRIAGHWV